MEASELTKNSPTLGRLKHLWHCVVYRKDNGDKHELDIDAYWDPEQDGTEDAIIHAATCRAVQNDYKQQGGQGLPPYNHYKNAYGYFAVTEVNLVA